jgi:choline kinase
MKFIIFNSGIGSRLKPLTDETPKCLIKISEKTILEHQIDNSCHIDFDEIIITTGPHEEKIKSFLYKKYPQMDFTFINNPQYDKTNYIYSMWLAREHLDTDLITLHGDLLFDKVLIDRLAKTASFSHVLMNKDVPIPEKDFKGLIQGDRVVKIGVNVFDNNAYFLAPLYKLLKKDVKTLMDEIDYFIQNQRKKEYAEEAFNSISDQIVLKPLLYTKEMCLEIDTLDDLKIARAIIKKGIS